MNTLFQCDVDNNILEKFEIALALTKETRETVVEDFMKQYISLSFSRASQAYRQSAQSANSVEATVETGKAIGRIPIWARRGDQINHKIIRAFFQLECELGEVPLKELERRCLDNTNHRDVYIPTFKSNYAQMKMDAPKSHGKVFEELDGKVIIWDRVKAALMEYKDSFC